MVISDSLLKCKCRRRKLHVLEVLIEVYDQASALQLMSLTCRGVCFARLAPVS